MNRAAKAGLAPALIATLALSACGGSSSKSGAGATTTTTSTSTSTATTSATDTSSATGTSSTGASNAASQCPTSNTKAFAKTRFVADLGLIGGTFHHWIYKPYQAGAFQKGASGRTKTIVKATAVAGLDAHLVNKAYTDVQASPALCKVLITPLGQLKDAMGGLKGSIASGNLGNLAAIDGIVKNVEGTAGANGAKVTENDSVSAAQKAASGS